MARRVPKWVLDPDAALRWARRYTDIDIDEDIDHYEDLAFAYSDLAERAVKAKTLEIYRAITLEVPPTVIASDESGLFNLVDPGSLDLKEIGKCWSAVRAGAQPLLGSIAGVDVVIRAEVAVRDIDWEFGFVSFLYYGEDQWEVALRPNSKVEILAIDHFELAHPVVASSGDATECYGGY